MNSYNVINHIKLNGFLTHTLSAPFTAHVAFQKHYGNGHEQKLLQFAKKKKKKKHMLYFCPSFNSCGNVTRLTRSNKKVINIHVEVACWTG